MEQILNLYAQDYDPQRPTVCFDEKSVQLLEDVREPISMTTTQSRREDYEYKRNGTRNLFVFVEPQAGYREVLVTQHRRKSDFAYAMRYLVDVIYPEADMIDVVLDNLNTHHYHSLVEFFGKVEADRIMDRLSFHFTPSHGSWLNMAEIELSILTRQCLKRRLPDEMTLATEILAWEAQRNAIAKPFNWSFTIEDARNVFKESYPSVSLN